MPLYFFHTNLPDAQAPEAIDFDSIAAVKCEAVRYAARLLADAAQGFWDQPEFEMAVTDENGLILFTMRLVGTEAPVIRGSSRRQPA